MAIKPPNGNHVILEDVRVSYDSENDSLFLTSKDPDLEGGFRLTLNGGRKSEMLLRNLMEKTGYVFPDPQSDIPEFLSRKDAPTDSQWNNIPLGRSDVGEVVWNARLYPHAISSGGAGLGRLSITESVLSHCLRHEDRWEVHALDITGIHFNENTKAARLGLSTDLISVTSHLKDLRNKMKDRHALLEKNKGTRFEEIEDAPKPVIVIVENSAEIFNHSLYPSDSDKTARDYKVEATEYIRELVEAGSKVDIHVLLAGNFTSKNTIPAKISQRIDARFVVGKVSATDSIALLGNNAACTKTKSGIKGRAIAQFDSRAIPFQTYAE